MNIVQIETATLSFDKKRKIIKVFRDYGISLTKEMKLKNFLEDLKMEPIFVMGLIFELECQLELYLPDEKVPYLQTPKEILMELIWRMEDQH